MLRHNGFTTNIYYFAALFSVLISAALYSLVSVSIATISLFAFLVLGVPLVFAYKRNNTLKTSLNRARHERDVATRKMVFNEYVASDSNTLGIYLLLDLNGHVCDFIDMSLYFSKAICDYYIGRHFNDCFHSASGSSFSDVLDSLGKGNSSIDCNGVFNLRHDSGRTIEVTISITKCLDQSNLLKGYVLKLNEMSPIRNVAFRLQAKAYLDGYLGIYNRRALDMFLAAVLEESHESNSEHAFIIIGMNNIYSESDATKHSSSNETLIEICSIIDRSVRNTDVLSRFDVDKLGLLLSYCDLNKATEIANKIVNSIDYELNSHIRPSYDNAVSLGISSIAKYCFSVKEIIASAEYAYRMAQSSDLSTYTYHHDSFEIETVRKNQKMVQSIVRALNENKLIVYAQPIVPILETDDTYNRYELLIRYKDLSSREKVLKSAQNIISTAEAYHLMPTIDRWVVSRAIQLLEYFSQSVTLCVNLSGQTLADDDFVSFVKNAFVERNVNPKNICFEITETATIENIDRARSVISALKEIGCHFALDDFGSGLSSFKYLQRLNVDYLKIDGEFVRNVNTNVVSASIVKAISDIAKTMNIKTIAEYVEKEEVLITLSELGINYAQGNYHSAPVPIDKLPN